MVAESVAQSQHTAERDELVWLLQSRGLSRSANLARVLKFICEEYFAGRDGELKEYSIAVEALGRRTDFDPQTDTIVRVTVHSLRKRLAEIYEQEGASRRLRVIVPPGHYVPSFVPHGAGPEAEPVARATHSLPAASPEPQARQTATGALVETERGILPGATAAAAGAASRRGAWPIVLATVVGLAAAGYALHRAYPRFAGSTARPSAAAPLGPFADIHALFGARPSEYTDGAGQVWSPGTFCTGGDVVAAPSHDTAGTQDPVLFAGGIRGIARCTFPVKRGVYELHFFFSEPSDLPIATRVAQYSVNAGPYVSYDVVDEAGGTGRATSAVVTGVVPENDGSIHVDYISEVSPLNAVEIVPAPAGKLLPVRIVAGKVPITDADGQRWMPDRYFSGGRHGQDAGSNHSGGVYSSDRIGRFSYNIPVVPLAHYRIRLYFREPWFGPGNGGKGGVGSRVFDVACNGNSLLKNFDILAEGQGSPVVKEFANVQANAVGRLDIEFLPAVNYPMVNAIEVVAVD